MTITRKNMSIPLIELMILKEFGLLAFHYRVDKNDPMELSVPMKNDLFAGFISAITSFTRQTTGKDLLSLRFKEKILYQVRKHGLIACAVIANTNHDENKIRQLLGDILDTYSMIFKEDESTKHVVKFDASKQEQFRAYLTKILHIDENQGTDLLSQDSAQHHEIISTLLRDVEKGLISHSEASRRINDLYAGFQSLSDREKLEVITTLDELERIINKSNLPKETKKRLKKIKNSISLNLKVKKWLDDF